MFSFSVQNRYGETLEITHNPGYSVKSISGFDPPDARINETQYAGADGSEFNSAFMNPRTVTITLAINGPAESNRVNLYKYFKSREFARLFYKTDTRDVYIDGYVQSFTVAYFDKKETAQIVVHCPRPALNQSGRPTESVIDMSGPLFEFPFDIDAVGIPFSEAVDFQTVDIINPGDLETGFIVNLYIMGAVTKPIIYKESTGESMLFNLSLQAGDVLTVCTIPGSKAITRTRNGVKTGLMGYFTGVWLTLAPGYNPISFTADTGGENVVAVFDVVGQFEGV